MKNLKKGMKIVESIFCKDMRVNKKKKKNP